MSEQNVSLVSETQKQSGCYKAQFIIRALAILLLFIILNHPLTLAQDMSCDSVLSVARYTSRNRGNVYTRSSLKYLFCENQYSSYQEARNAGLKIGIPIDGLPLEIGGSYRDANWNEYRRKVCESLETQSYESSSWENVTERIETEAIDAWTQCRQAGGLRFWAEVDGDNQRQFTLYWKWAGENNINETRATGPISFPPSKKFDTYGSILKAGDLIGSGQAIMGCFRPDDDSVDIILSTRNGSKKVRIPKIVPPNYSFKRSTWLGTDTALIHKWGHPIGTSWTTDSGATNPGYDLADGPGYKPDSGTGSYTVTWELSIDNNDADDCGVLELVVFDSITRTQVDKPRVINRRQFLAANKAQSFSKSFDVNESNVNHSFNFTTTWYRCAGMTLHQISVKKN